MQCRRCDFQNIPNAARCARCGAALAVIDDVAVTPPRAGDRLPDISMGYAWRRFPHDVALPFRALAFRALNSRLEADNRNADAGPPAPLLHALLLSIIPGLCQFVTRRRISGVVIFVLWLTALLISLSTPWMLAIAASIHVHAIIDAVYRNSRITTVHRVVVSLILFLFLWYVAYAAALGLGGHFFHCMYVSATAVDAGWQPETALLLWTHRGRPAPYDLVRYNRERFSQTTGDPGHDQTAFIIWDGLDLGSVIAVSGDTVSFVEGRILVNGADIDPPRLIAGVPRPWPDQFNGLDITIDPGYVFLIPSRRLPFHLLSTTASKVTLLKQFYVLEEKVITDRAVAVISPISRMQRL